MSMSETVTKKASEVELGDMLHFPKSRHAQEVTMIEKNESSVTVGCDGTQWVLPFEKDVQVDLPKEDE